MTKSDPSFFQSLAALTLEVAAASVAGVTQSNNADKKLADANQLVADAQERYEQAEAKLLAAHQETQTHFEDLAKLKQQVFAEQIGHFLRVCKQRHNKNSASSELEGFDVALFVEDLAGIEKNIAFTLERNNLLATVNFDTLSAAAAAFRNWESKPDGMLSGMFDKYFGGAERRSKNNWAQVSNVTSSVVNSYMESAFKSMEDAEKSFTEAQAYVAQVETEIGKLEVIEVGFSGLRENVRELGNVLTQLVVQYEEVKSDEPSDKTFEAMRHLATAIRDIMAVKVAQEDGSAVPNIKQVCSGLLEQVV